MIGELWDSIIQFTSRFVIPDWGQLIALLPIFLLIPVFLYLTWVIYRFATAGPTRRGKRRMEPVPPAGIHMPGPSFAPFLGAVGFLFFVFGMVAGGIWLPVGATILVVTLLYWGREALRDYDAIPAATGEVVVTGMLPAPAGEPPAGVHIPPPSFRPLLVSIAMTVLVLGMVVGGWMLFVGAAAIVVTGLGWLLDSRKEYQAVEEADRTGHLDLGGKPAWPKATFAAIAVLFAVGLLFESGLLGNSGAAQGEAGASGAPTASGGAAGGGGAPASAAPSLPAADVTITANGINWVETSVTAPAGKAFTIAFDNQDSGVPHDVVIKDAGGQSLFQGEIVTGPKVVVYDVPAIPAGSYTFVCTVHPNMTGTVTVQ